MDYQQGLVRLRREIVRAKNSEALPSFDAFSRELTQSNDPEEAATAMYHLNRFSYRYTGVPFDALCSRRRHTARVYVASLRQMLCLLLVVILLPLGAALASPTHASLEASAQPGGTIDQIEQETQTIDQLVASGVTSPFYLNSEVSPCSPTTLQQLQMGRVVIHLDGLSDEGCMWVYMDTAISQTIMIDYRTHIGIIKRDYVLSKAIIAEDIFGQDSESCFKHRTYFAGGVSIGEQCYSEAGVPEGTGLPDTLRSPIPPPFYWFFYR